MKSASRSIFRFIVYAFAGLSLSGLIALFSYDIGNYLKRKDKVELAIVVWKVGDIFGNSMSSGRLGLVYWIGDSVEKDYTVSRVYLQEGLNGGGDHRYLYYALAVIDYEQGKVEKAVETFAHLCIDEDFSGACKQLCSLTSGKVCP
jgi:hypothetical protein